MAVATANALLMTDGDAAFLRVDNRRPPHALEPGVVARAVNCRFDQGKPGPRFGVDCPPWGKSSANMATGSYAPAGAPLYATHSYVVVAVEVGARYTYIGGSATTCTSDRVTTTTSGGDIYTPGSSLITSGRAFVASGPLVLIWKTGTTTEISDSYLARLGNTCAYARFSDPTTETDNTILVTDDWRDGAGEDGGRGRAWRITPGNNPLQISLNGHDVWDTARLVQCENAMVLLRHGNQRYYFSAGAMLAANRIQLNVTPTWKTTDPAQRVIFKIAQPGSAIYGTSPPTDGGYYYAKHITGDKIELYRDASATAILDIDIVTHLATGAFYIEECVDPLPFWDNAAQNLIMQPGPLGETAFDMGFDWVLENVAVTSTVAATGLIVAPNHRLQPGDKVDTNLTTTDVADKYAAPQGKDQLKLYNTSDAALVDDGTTELVSVTDSETGTIWKSSAAGMPLPPCREGAYLNGRFIGIAKRDTIIVSDPMDFLHCTIWAANVPANVGDAGRANWIRPLGDDVVAIGKDLNVIGIAGLSGAASTWTERIITAEYNGLAPLAAEPVGTDLWFAARKGLASVVRTAAGETLGVVRTVSASIPADLQDIDWVQARQMAAATWNNRLFWAVPTKGQLTPVNNKVLVFNFLNQFLRLGQVELAGDVGGGIGEVSAAQDAWEGVWTGDLLTPYAFARLTVNGEERLTFATPDGLVCWLHDGWDDNGAEIESEVLTRGYFGGREMLVLKGKLNWDTFNPSITASIVTAGVSEEETLAGFDALTYDRTKYLVDGAADYDPATSTEAQFDAPHREDYSPTAEELTVARLDLHQNLTEPFRCRVRGTAPQLRITNTQGSLRLASVSLQAKPVGVAATRTT